MLALEARETAAHFGDSHNATFNSTSTLICELGQPARVPPALRESVGDVQRPQPYAKYHAMRRGGR